MSGEVALVTGVSRGLGRAVAVEMARAGAAVVGVYARDAAGAAEAGAEVAAAGGAMRLVRLDLARDPVDPAALPELASASRVMLVNNAWAPFAPRPFHLLAWDEFERGLSVGVRGAWACTRAVLPAMVRRRAGAIVNVASAAARGTPPGGFGAYVTAKHALRGLTLAVASEYADLGVKVLSVSPGFLGTAMSEGWDPRFVASIRAAGACSDVAAVARRIVELARDPSTPGRGEDYPA